RFSTDQGVVFQSESLSGMSRSCVYTQTQKKAELSGDVRLILRTERDFRGPVEVKADTFEYFLGKGKGRAEGRVMLGHGRSWAWADKMHFKMAASREQMKSLVLEGRTALHLEGEFEKAESSNGQGVFILYPDIWEIRAKEIHLMGFVDEPRIQSVEAVKGCSLKFIAESGAFTQVESGRISFKLSRRGRLKELSAEKDVRISAESGEDGSLRALSGAGLQMQEDRMSITVEGRPEDPARFVFQRSDFTAERFVFSLKNKDFEAHKEIHAVLQQAEDQEEGTSGFFKRESPVFIQGESLRYAESEKRYVFKGKVKAWQGSRTLAADELSVERESGVLKARGRVTSVLFSRTGKKEEEERFQIRAEKADYLAEEDRVVYEGGVRLDLKDGFLQTETLSLSLKGEGREVSHIAALGKVVVIQGRYEGRGGHAKFDIEQEMIVITENPVFIEKGKGQTQGTKLTFHMADGRIVIENRERERSTTVIKS
ncbi:MAG: LptA/OstA family protein, partial [Candidatus Aminicenantales bacterium]